MAEVELDAAPARLSVEHALDHIVRLTINGLLDAMAHGEGDEIDDKCEDVDHPLREERNLERFFAVRAANHVVLNKNVPEREGERERERKNRRGGGRFSEGRKYGREEEKKCVAASSPSVVLMWQYTCAP